MSPYEIARTRLEAVALRVCPRTRDEVEPVAWQTARDCCHHARRMVDAAIGGTMIDVDSAEEIAGHIITDATPDAVRDVVVALCALAGKDVAGRYHPFRGEWADLYPLWLDAIRRVICEIEAAPSTDPAHATRVQAMRACLAHANALSTQETRR